MAIYPKAVVRLLPQNATQPAIVPRKIIHHTAVDGTNTTTLFDWFAGTGAKGAESHFYVRKDGTVEQYMDTQVRSDANWDANVDAVSIETWDGRAPDKPAVPWNDAQVASLIELDRWLCATHPIAPVLCPSATGTGLGWHSQYRAWAKDGHDCPGQPRIDQLVNVIIPALSAPAPTTRGSHDMLSAVTFLPTHPSLPNCGVEARAAFGTVALRWQPKVGANWGTFQPITKTAPPFPVDSVNLRQAYDGSLDVLAWDSTNPGKGVLRISQLAPGGAWSAWNQA